ncbi:MAG: M20/M25/M40 family metallo-hydrolase, partial [Phycisphaerales bacterium]
DMKGSVALAMNVFACVDVDRLTHPLVLLFTYDEELGSLGAQRFADTRSSDQPLPPNVLVGEPTSLRAVRMHKGHLTMRITVRGKAAHSGSPHLGVNAIEAAAAVVRSLSKLAEQFKQQRIDSGRFFREVPFPVLNVAQISGGTAINIVPDRCVVDLGIRPLPGMNPQAMIEWIKDTVAKSDPHGNINVEVLNVNPPLSLEETAPIYAALSGLLSQTQSYAVSYASDAGVLQAMGLQCVLFGPGSIEVAHRPNEYVPIDEFNRARSIIERLVARFCMS